MKSPLFFHLNGLHFAGERVETKEYMYCLEDLRRTTSNYLSSSVCYMYSSHSKVINKSNKTELILNDERLSSGEINIVKLIRNQFSNLIKNNFRLGVQFTTTFLIFMFRSSPDPLFVGINLEYIIIQLAHQSTASTFDNDYEE